MPFISLYSSIINLDNFNIIDRVNIKDKQTISLDGKLIHDEIEGLIIHHTKPIEDCAVL